MIINYLHASGDYQVGDRQILMSYILTFVSVIQSQMQSHFPQFVGGVFAKALDVQPLDFSRIRWSFIIYEIMQFHIGLNN